MKSSKNRNKKKNIGDLSVSDNCTCTCASTVTCICNYNGSTRARDDNSFNQRWVRKFITEVAGKSKHGKPFTLYRITSYIYPRNSPEAVTVLTVLKRYNELRKLRKSLAKLHEQLKLPGEMPDYAHWSYFKRFHPQVIEERLQTTRNFLDFVALSPALFTSTEFVQFFQSSHLDLCSEDVSGNIDNIRNSLLLPVEVIKPIEYQTSEEESLSISQNSNTVVAREESLTVVSDEEEVRKSVGSQVRNPSSYIFEAGHVLHLGAQNEAEGNYSAAFHCYKAGIEKLLVGVQGETSEMWRNLVKDKTDKYLGYAKNIYINHLQNADKLNPSTKDEIFRNSVYKKVSLCRPYEYLEKYKLVRLLNHQIMLVLCMETNLLCVLKVMMKMSVEAGEAGGEVQVLPHGVPYMVKLISYIETENLVFLFLEYLPGDNLFHYIAQHFSQYNQMDETLNSGKLDNKTQSSPMKNNIISSKCLLKWAAELLVALDHLHQRGVICYDLNPENVLLGDKGHLTITYISGKTLHHSLVLLSNSSRPGPPDYLTYVAPELLNSPLQIPDERLCDFWSYGALLYKLLLQQNLSSVHPTGFNSHTTLLFPHEVSENLESLLNKLLCFDPNERLGSGPTGINEIKFHPYFSDIDWNIVETEYDLNFI